ncbi:Protein WALLS ARE THIN 1 [Acorus calamus]|uniref:WAT1-related protein n=1 Tax=Acorus calamus TaxID=4465 RepID=A0AAV9CKZ5_ACOCL|nr:Protein WALLS ARE THIN 1 [Acorus calamus]
MAESGSWTTRVCGAVPEKAQLHLAMLALQFGYAGFHVVSRAALNMGISKLVFPVYRNIIALLLLSPFAYFLEKKDRPPLTLSFAIQFFFLALCGITANQGFYLLGLDNTSPTFASAIQNSVPAITFVMAAALRIEKVRIDRRDGIAKIIGTLACVGGASVITLYQGPTIFGGPTKPLHQTQWSSVVQSITTTVTPTTTVSTQEWMMVRGDMKNWALGCVYLICHCLSWSGWLVLQAPVLKKYPARLSVTSYTCFFGVIQFLIIAAFMERDSDAWMFHNLPELFTILYAGIVASGIAFAVQIWCIDRGGPVFVAVYQPVQTLVVAIMASVALGEEFYLGGVIGAVLIIIGLYFVLWGKSQEAKFAKETSSILASSNNRPTSAKSASLTQPLLPPVTETV